MVSQYAVSSGLKLAHGLVIIHTEGGRVCSPSSSRPAQTQRLEEVLPEALVEEAVDDGVGAAVGIAEQLKHGHGDPERAALMLVEEPVDVAGKERKPGYSEQHHNHQEHAHNALLLRQAPVT